MAAARPDFVFHLAAQSIVRSAHAHPTDTWSTNVMGSVNVLEALRGLNRPCAAVFVTTDKVYRGSERPHAEDDSLGARDPYGGSKAAVELAVDAWREAFFSPPKLAGQRFPMVALATARSGNVIGGGDWAEDRLLPDCVRALAAGMPIVVRNPASIRPWQHVLDPLQGYLLLAAELRLALRSKRSLRLIELSGAFNFGPPAKDHRHVREVVAEMLKHWPGQWHKAAAKDAPDEAAILRLNAGKARRVLGWRPRRNFSQAVHLTTKWYRDAVSSKAASILTAEQIDDYGCTQRYHAG
jgi:CDP-glucose 4,6-dehydratase